MSAIQSISPRQQRARYLILSAAVPVAWARAKAHGTVDAVAVRDEWMQGSGTAAPGAAHPTHTLRLSPELTEHGFTDLKPAPGDPTFTVLWDALSLDGDLVVLIETHGRDASITEWITCLTAEPQVAAVAFEGPGSFQQMLQWPLRIGVSANADGAALRTLLEGGHFSELYTLADADAMEVDLWLATESLEDAAAAARPECAALLVLAPAGPDASPVAWGTLQWQARVAALAACAVPREEWGPWFQALVRELAHDRPLPAALFSAALAESRRWEGPDRLLANLPAPIVVGDGDFLLNTSRISMAAQALGHALNEISPELLRPTPELSAQLGFNGLGTVGDAFSRRAEGFTFRNEEGDATALVRIRREVEQQQGAPIPGPVRNFSPAPPAEFAETSPPDEGFPHAPPPGSEDEPAAAGAEPHEDAALPKRHVQAKLLQHDGHDVSDQPMAPAQAYRLRLHIGPRSQGVRIVASAALDESELPQSEDGHPLAIAYIPLSRLDEDDAAPPAPQRAELKLPASGDSTPVEFELQPGRHPTRFRARIVVMFANRVLQTLLLDANATGLLQLQEENAYQPTLAPDPKTRPAQIAFVINDDLQGRPGLATLTLDSSSFVDSGSLAAEIAAISVMMEEANRDAVGTTPAFDDEDAVRRLRGLAMHGSALLAEVQRAHGVAPLAASTHVQLVEAVAEAFFPIEFLYDGEPPLPDATLCPNARAALDDPAVHAGCPHAASEDHVCPAQFWGLRKCIERLPARPPAARQADAGGAPLPESATAGRLGPFQRALVGASKIARAQMDAQTGLPARVRASVPQVTVATDWKDWRRQVSAVSPDLMILLPHSLILADVPNMAALEISLSELPSSSIRTSYVRGTLAPGPVVLLLGCSTALTKAPFLNFVRQFQQAGAPVVVGTLAIIHGTQAAAIAARFLDMVDASAAPRRFDEVLLDFKRRLLGEGHQGVLSLISYGHASWEI